MYDGIGHSFSGWWHTVLCWGGVGKGQVSACVIKGGKVYLVKHLIVNGFLEGSWWMPLHPLEEPVTPFIYQFINIAYQINVKPIRMVCNVQ